MAMVLWPRSSCYSGFSSSIFFNEVSLFTRNHRDNVCGLDVDCKLVTIAIAGEDEFVSDIQEMEIYPNPAENIVNMIFPGVGIGEIYSASGQLVNQFEVINETQITLDITDLEVGMYLVRFMNDEVFITQQLVVR